MPVRIFQLRGVPEDEAEEVRQLLESHGIDFYETPAGNWGISSPGLWLRDEAQADEARALIDGYQIERAERERGKFQALIDAGQRPRLIDGLRREPLKVLGLLLIAGVVAYFSIAPFIAIG